MREIRVGNLDNQAAGGGQESLANGEEKTPLGVASSVPNGGTTVLGQVPRPMRPSVGGTMGTDLEAS